MTSDPGGPELFDPWPEFVVRLGGGAPELHVRHAAPTSPGAEPAVFVHGLGGSSTNWTDLMGLLRDHLDGAAPDLPGFGASPLPDDADVRPGALATLVEELIEQRGAGPVHLFGNSLGGAVATVVAGRHPDLVRTLTLVSPALPDRVPHRTTLPMALMALPVVGERVTAHLSTREPERRLDQVLRLTFADPAAVPDVRREEAMAEIRRRRDLPYATRASARSLRGLVGTYLRPGASSPWNDARRVQAPVLAVYGRRDRLVSWKTSRRAGRTFPHVRTVVLADGGHVTQTEQPQVLARLWLDFRAGLT